MEAGLKTYPKVPAAARCGKKQRISTDDKRCCASSAPANVLDSDPNEVQVISLWDKEVKKKEIYMIA
jgi:hypothetical protein